MSRDLTYLPICDDRSIVGQPADEIAVSEEETHSTLSLCRNAQWTNIDLGSHLQAEGEFIVISP
jgi:hypothetical protein